ncbi:MAG: trypsin-like peptidase domain-containing protein [Planctomycetes bacterium]|nr:trypsin-like peptidase domain-containing protein [Planctomycetota bacterium]
MRPQLLHLSGPERGRTVTYDGPVVRIGSDAASDARLTAAGVAPQHARIDWVESECQFHLRRIDGQVFVNGNEVEEVVLQDDDRIEFGADGPTARFRIYVPIGAVCKPVRRMLADARDVARVSGGAAATQTLTRDLLTQATPTLKVGVPAVVVASAFLAGWLGGWVGSRPTESDRARSADMVTHAELEDLRQQARKQQDELRSMAAANASVRRIQKEWSRGVCLMHGVFRVRHSDGSWVEQRGRPIEYEYTGSGFLATKEGHVVTNRHVALPWLEVESLGPLVARGAAPEFVHFTATFPGRAPIDVPAATIQRRSDDLDVAVVRLDPAQVDGVPVLPLHQGAIDSDDQRAIVVGYPLGLAALLARADPHLVEGLQQRSASLTEAIAELAAAAQVSPLITQGIVSDQKEFAIVYDAATTFGGSGGPVFGGTGEVIAVNAAIMQNFGGANLGVPIRFAQELLPK